MGETAAPAHDSRPDQRVVGMVANLREVKGHLLFIRAMKMVLNQVDDVIGIIVGQSQRQNDLLRSRFGRECDGFIPPGHPLPDEEIVKSKNLEVLWVANFSAVKRPELFVELTKRF